MGNVWKQFENLLPKKKQFIGEVTSINSADKTCTVDIVGGGNFVVKGDDVTVGNSYLIEDGEIKREVPGLSVSTVTIY
jgi:hypothetical protein